MSNLESTPKIDVKIYTREENDSGEGIAAELIPIFHGWIQNGKIESLLLDVADYSHVPDGPGVVLIGHDAQWSLDLDGGRCGLQLSRRRETHPSLAGHDGLSARLRSALRDALQACALLEQEPSLGGRLRFAGDALRLRLNDRLAAPNDTETFEQVQAALVPLLEELWPGAQIELRADDDPRALLTVHVRATEGGALDVQTLLARLAPAS